MSGVNYHAWTHRPKAVGGTDPIESLALWPIKVFRDDIAVDVIPSFTYKVPQDLDGHTLVRVEGYVVEVGGSATEVQLVKNPNGAADDMLTTLLTIPASDLNDDEGAVVDPTFATVAYGDHIRAVVQAASGAVGLGVYMYFLAGPDVVTSVTGPEGPEGPAGATGATGATGPQGDPGGIVAWTGEWDSGTSYSVDDAVSWLGSSYVAIDPSTNVEPGVDAGWETDWMLLAEGATSDIGTDGWTTDAATWTRTANTTFTVTGDRTLDFQKGTRLKATDTTTKYFVVTSSSHSAGTTTVTITGGSDYVLAATPSAQWYSYQEGPQGFPRYFNYTPTWGSTGTQPAIGNGSISGDFSISASGRVLANAALTAGSTSTYGTGNYTLSLPVAARGTHHELATCYILNDSTAEYLGWGMTASSTTIYLYFTTGTLGVWSPSQPFTFGTLDQAQLHIDYIMG